MVMPRIRKINTHEYLVIKNGIRAAGITDEDFCRFGKLQSICELTQDRYWASVVWLMQLARGEISINHHGGET